MLVDIDGIVRYSDEMVRIHYGEVIDNADPKKIGRVKVKIKYLLEGSKDELPWVYPALHSPKMFDVPEVGDKIKVIFRNGDIYQPEYVGFYHSTETHDALFDEDYPDKFGIHRKGFQATYNMKKEMLEVVMPNGSFLKMNKDGDMLINTSKDIKATITGKADIKATGNIQIISDGEATFSGKAKTTIGDEASQTFVNGQMVLIGGPGGKPVATVGGQAVGIGNAGAPVLSTIIQGSSKVMAV